MSKPNSKIGDTSIRVLETLKFLSKNKASIHDILKYFERTDFNNKTYTNEVILKYINTLKVFGFRFGKEKDKYILLNRLNQFSFNEQDLKAIHLIEKHLSFLPEEKIKIELNQFLQEIERRFDDNTRMLANNIKKTGINIQKSSYYKYSSQIKEYEKYCTEGQRLKITYKNKENIEISIMVEPDEIKYINNNVYLSVYNPVSAQIQDIELNSILKIEQLPLKSNLNNLYSSVTFRLKDKLAKAYKLKESEELLRTEHDGSTIILNKREDRILLLKRLMRYGENCEVISPKNIREEMKQLIKETLKNYV